VSIVEGDNEPVVGHFHCIHCSGKFQEQHSKATKFPSYNVISKMPYTQTSTYFFVAAFGQRLYRQDILVSSPHCRVQNCSGALPASYPMGTRGSFPVRKAAWV